MKSDLKAYWQGLNERDRAVLGIGGLIVIVYLIYLLVYSPLIHAVESKSRQWVDKKETLIWMQNQAKIKQSTKQTDKNLLSVFSNQLKLSSFSQFPYQLQQTGEDNIQLSFENVPYAEYLEWLRHLNEEYNFTIIELTAIRSKTPGLVKLRMIAANQGKRA